MLFSFLQIPAEGDEAQLTYGCAQPTSSPHIPLTESHALMSLRWIFSSQNSQSGSRWEGKKGGPPTLWLWGWWGMPYRSRAGSRVTQMQKTVVITSLSPPSQLGVGCVKPALKALALPLGDAIPSLTCLVPQSCTSLGSLRHQQAAELLTKASSARCFPFALQASSKWHDPVRTNLQ